MKKTRTQWHLGKWVVRKGGRIGLPNSLPNSEVRALAMPLLQGGQKQKSLQKRKNTLVKTAESSQCKGSPKSRCRVPRSQTLTQGCDRLIQPLRESTSSDSSIEQERTEFFNNLPARAGQLHQARAAFCAAFVTVFFILFSPAQYELISWPSGSLRYACRQRQGIMRGSWVM